MNALYSARLKREAEFLRIFPGGRVPLLSPVVTRCALEGSDETQCFMVALERCRGEQMEKLIGLFHDRSGVPKSIIRIEILEQGLPLRASQVEAVEALEFA